MDFVLLLFGSLGALIAVILGMLLLTLRSLQKIRTFIISEAHSMYAEVEDSKSELILSIGKAPAVVHKHMQPHLHIRAEKRSSTGNELVDAVEQLQDEYSVVTGLLRKAKSTYYDGNQSDFNAMLAEITSRLDKHASSFNKAVRLFNAVITKPPYILFTKHLGLKHITELK